MKPILSIHYSVRHSGNSFSEINRNKKTNELNTTLEQAKETLNDFCTSEAEEYKAYWESQRPSMKIFKVTTVTEEIPL